LTSPARPKVRQMETCIRATSSLLEADFSRSSTRSSKSAEISGVRRLATFEMCVSKLLQRPGCVWCVVTICGIRSRILTRYLSQEMLGTSRGRVDESYSHSQFPRTSSATLPPYCLLRRFDFLPSPHALPAYNKRPVTALGLLRSFTYNPSVAWAYLLELPTTLRLVLCTSTEIT